MGRIANPIFHGIGELNELYAHLEKELLTLRRRPEILRCTKSPIVFFPRLLHFPEISLAIDHAAAGLCAVAPCFDRTIELVRIWNSFLCGQVVHKWAF